MAAVCVVNARCLQGERREFGFGGFVQKNEPDARKIRVPGSSIDSAVPPDEPAAACYLR